MTPYFTHALAFLAGVFVGGVLAVSALLSAIGG